MEPVTLEGAHLSVVVDPGRGSDILSVVDRRTGIDVMFSTPWRPHADGIRDGRESVTAVGSMPTWLEQYRGGWQILCPNAGPARTAHDAPFGYHGEASIARWWVSERTASSLRLTTSLFTLPLQIDRLIDVDASGVSVHDRVTNLSGVPVSLDIVHHPALGGDFLEGALEIRTGARTFVSDIGSESEAASPCRADPWPLMVRADGTIVDLSAVSGTSQSGATFGWLTDFDGHWASVTNTRLGMTVRIDWDGTRLPYAWFWQELNGSPGWPWFRRARVLAIEPSSTPTSGPQRASAISLDAHGQVVTSMRLSVAHHGPFER